MALGAFVAGAYAATYTVPSGSPAALGITRDGWKPTIAILEEECRQSDVFGRTLIESFYQGARAGISCTFLEWQTSALNMLFPYGSLVSTSTGKLIVANSANPIGRLGSAVAGSLILTATANTPAAAKPATVTYGLIKPVSDRDMEWSYNSTHRVMTGAWECMLYASSSDFVLYTYT